MKITYLISVLVHVARTGNADGTSSGTFRIRTASRPCELRSVVPCGSELSVRITWPVPNAWKATLS